MLTTVFPLSLFYVKIGLSVLQPVRKSHIYSIHQCHFVLRPCGVFPDSLRHHSVNTRYKGHKQLENPESKPCAVFFVSYCLSLQGAAHAAPSGDNKLVRTTRVKRQTPGGDQPPSASPANQTLWEQPVVFNHVYNINVPLESLCSVDLDASAPPAPGDGEVF